MCCDTELHSAMALRWGDQQRVECVLATLVCLSMSAGRVAAQSTETSPEAISLDWHGPDSCNDGAAAIAVARGVLVDAIPAEAHLDAAVEVSQSDDGVFHAAIRMEQHGVTTTRTLDGQTCASITEASGLVFALALAPESSNIDSAPRPAPPIAPPPPPSGAPAPQVGDSRRLHLEADVGGSLSLGLTPGVAFGARVAAGVWLSALRVGVHADVLATTTATLDSRATADFSLASVGLDLCGGLRRSTLAISGCAGVELGDLVGTGLNAAQTFKLHTFVGAFVLGTTLQWWVADPIGVHVGAGVEIPWIRTSFRVDDMEIFRPSAIGIRILAGASFTFL